MQPENKSQHPGQGTAIASLILGIASIVLAIAWFISVILGIVAIVLGVVSLKSSGRGKAIAGIITGCLGMLLSLLTIVLVFTAIPALQQNTRDTARKNDVARITAEIAEYQSENMGKLPNTEELEARVYSSGDLSLNLNQIQSIGSTSTPTIENAEYLQGEDCNGNFGSRNYAVTILLEAGDEYCLGS